MNSKTTEINNYSYRYWSKLISFSLIPSERKQLRIEVTPEMDVVVKAPHTRNIEDVIARVKQKSPWIIKQCIFFEQFYPKMTTRKYKSWETFYVLWKEYILYIEQENTNSVCLEQNKMHVWIAKNSTAEKVIQQWYLDLAKEKFPVYNKEVQKRFVHYGVSPKRLIIRKMKSRRWSCSKKGNITLNTDLIQAPKGCIEYVLNHEYCHLIEFGHTRKFYELQKETMPDWSKWKNKLEKLLA